MWWLLLAFDCGCYGGYGCLPANWSCGHTVLWSSGYLVFWSLIFNPGSRLYQKIQATG